MTMRRISQKTTKRSIGLRGAWRTSDRRLVVHNRRLLCEALEDRALLSVGLNSTADELISRPIPLEPFALPIMDEPVEALRGSLSGAGEVADYKGASTFTWTDPALLSTHNATNSGYDYDPQVTTDSAGNWVAVWGATDSLGGTIGTDGDIPSCRVRPTPAAPAPPAPLNINAG